MKQRRWLTIALLMIVSTGPVSAALPVIDWAHIEESIYNGIQIVKHLGVSRDILGKATEHVLHAVRMAEYLRGMIRIYRSPSVVWTHPRLPNVYGRTGGWQEAVTRGIGAYEAWRRATGTIINDPWHPIHFSPEQREAAEIEHANLEIADSTGANTLATLGAIRAVQNERDAAIGNLTADVLSDVPDAHTEAAHAAQANAIALIKLQVAREANQLAAVSAEMQLLRMKQDRDIIAQTIQAEASGREQGRQLMQSIAQDARGFETFRLP